MVLSMTGFGRADFEKGSVTGFLEIRSLNHRHLDISVKLPDALRPFEKTARELVKAKINRGKIDCFLNLEMKKKAEETLEIDGPILRNLVTINNQLNREFNKDLEISFTDLMKWPGIISSKELSFDDYEEVLTELFNNTLEELLCTRKSEGHSIEKALKEKLNLFTKNFSLITDLIPANMEEAKNRLNSRLKQLGENIDNIRMEQEAVILIQKLDVSEELDRIKSHVEEMKRVFSRTDPIGRRLDFILQELTRETNTLGAKSNNIDISAAIIEMKVLLEQIREQVQNIE